MKNSLKIIVFVFLSMIPGFSEENTHEQFARHVVGMLFNSEINVVSASDQDCFDFLSKKGIEPKGGFQKGKLLDVEESVQLFGQLIGEKNKNNKMESNISEYKNRVTILNKTGEVWVQYNGKGVWQKAEVNMQIKESDLIKTSSKSTAHLRVGGIGNIFLKEKSLLDIIKMQVLTDNINEDIHLHLDQGKMVVNVQGMSKQSSFQTSIPSTLVAVRGTIYELDAD